MFKAASVRERKGCKKKRGMRRRDFKEDFEKGIGEKM